LVPPLSNLYFRRTCIPPYFPFPPLFIPLAYLPRPFDFFCFNFLYRNPVLPLIRSFLPCCPFQVGSRYFRNCIALLIPVYMLGSLLVFSFVLQFFFIYPTPKARYVVSDMPTLPLPLAPYGAAIFFQPFTFEFFYQVGCSRTPPLKCPP